MERNLRRSIAAALVAAVVLAAVLLAVFLAPSEMFHRFTDEEKVEWSAQWFFGYYDIVSALLSKGDGRVEGWSGDVQQLPETFRDAFEEEGMGESTRKALLEILALSERYESLRAMVAHTEDVELLAFFEESVGAEEVLALREQPLLGPREAFEDYLRRTYGDSVDGAEWRSVIATELEERGYE